MKKHQKIEGYSNLLRDVNSNAIINTDFNEYQKYLSMKNKKNSEMEILKNEVSELKNDLSEIKNLLRNLINGSN
jgi:hypothetical protein